MIHQTETRRHGNCSLKSLLCSPYCCIASDRHSIYYLSICGWNNATSIPRRAVGSRYLWIHATFVNQLRPRLNRVRPFLQDESSRYIFNRPQERNESYPNVNVTNCPTTLKKCRSNSIYLLRYY